MPTSITTIADLHAAVLNLRPDAAYVGVRVTQEHVRDAYARVGRHYEHLDAEDVGRIADEAVMCAVGEDDLDVDPE